MSRITFYGYFGPSSNVRDAGAGAPDIDSFAAAIAALPRRRASADVVALPIARDAEDRPLRFISVDHLQPGD